MNPIIELSDISVRRENRKILSDVSLRINRGDFVAVTGPNGGGKTTLLRVILRLMKPTTGSVRYFDSDGDVTGKLAVGYLPQKNMIDSRFPITVGEMVRLGIAKSQKLSSAEEKKLVEETIAKVGLEAYTGSGIGTLSGGQLQRALLARSIISSPELLVLDEPLSYLDRHFEHRVYEIIDSLTEGTTVILVSHDMSTIASMANRHLIVDHSRVEACHSENHFIHYECCDDCECGSHQP